VASLFLLLGCLALPLTAQDQPSSHAVIPAGTIVRVGFQHSIHPNDLRAGGALDGQLADPLYVQGTVAVPAGAHVHLQVEKVDKRGPHHGLVYSLVAGGKRVPAQYDFTTHAGNVTLPDGTAEPAAIEFLRWAEVKKIRTKNDEVSVGGESAGKTLAQHLPGVGKVEEAKRVREEYERHRHPVLTLRLTAPLALDFDVAPQAAVAPPVVIPAGTRARLLLLSELDSEHNKTGDTYQAELLDPIVTDGKLLLPEGTIVEGHVRKAEHPKRLSRGGTLVLGFDDIKVGDNMQRVSADVAAVEADKASQVHMDREGGMHGNRRGVKGVAVNFAEALVVQQATDEVVEMAVHAVAPYAGVGLGLFTFLGRHGNNVTLAKYSEVDVEFGRPVTLPASQPGAAPALSPAQPPAAPPAVQPEKPAEPASPPK
jgi:hypothetical protein